MADGMFGGDSSGGGGGGGGGYSDYSSHHYASGRGSGGDMSPEGIAVVLFILVLVIGFAMFYQAVEDSKAADAVAEERRLDRTVYVETSRANFDEWMGTRTGEFVEETLWFESGSSHFPNSGYHCKGGGYQTKAGVDITFCCSVVEGDNPLCIIATPNQ